MVWVFPVPGGPSTTTPLSRPSRSMICDCSALAGSGSRGSSASAADAPAPVRSSHAIRSAGSIASTSCARPSGTGESAASRSAIICS